MSDLFREVDEEIRRDRAAELWKRYGNYALGLALALVVGTGAYVAWRDYERRQATEASMQFFAAADLAAQGNAQAAAQSFDTLAHDVSGGYAALARLRAAALKAQSEDPAAAATAYRAIVDDSDAGLAVRNAASLLAAFHALERTDPAELQRQLAALQVEGGPWRFSAIEISALAAARAGDAQKARDLYIRLADDPAAPPGLRARAAEMLAALSG